MVSLKNFGIRVSFFGGGFDFDFLTRQLNFGAIN